MLSPFWPDMSQEERTRHFEDVGDRLLENRYRYYVLDAPVLVDHEYDLLEKYYDLLARELNVEAISSNMVDFDLKREDAQAAKARVDAGEDHYSKWLAEMRPVWDRLGPPKKAQSVQHS